MYQPCVLASSIVLLIMPTARSAAGVTMTFAPRNRMSLRRSTLNGSAMVITSGYPLAAQTIARPIPVFPLVASITVWPGLRSPDLSAASITPRANRSFTEPRGLKASILTKRLTPRGAKRLIRTTGVLPIVSTILWYFRPMLHLPTLRRYYPFFARANQKQCWLLCRRTEHLMGDRTPQQDNPPADHSPADIGQFAPQAEVDCSYTARNAF